MYILIQKTIVLENYSMLIKQKRLLSLHTITVEKSLGSMLFKNLLTCIIGIANTMRGTFTDGFTLLSCFLSIYIGKLTCIFH